MRPNNNDPLQRQIKFADVGGIVDQRQSVDFALDAGWARVVAARLRVDTFSGSSTPTATFTLQHAVLPNEDEFEDLLSFTTVTDSTELPHVEIKTNNNSTVGEFARYLRWTLDVSGTVTEVSFSIELVLKS